MQLLLVTATAALFVCLTFATKNVDSDGKFQQFKIDFNKEYLTVAEAELRRATFYHNLDLITNLNSNTNNTNLSSDTATFGIGPFADLTEAEFKAQYTSPPPPPVDISLLTSTSRQSGYLGEHRAHVDESFPPSLDWVAKGAVTSVKKQRCGNCWTFSAAGSLEGAHAIKTHTLTNYSEQEFVDCCDTGCGGGWNFNALKFAVNHTVCTLEDFPCTGEGNGTECATWESSPCSSAAGALVKGSLAGWKSVGGPKWGHTTENDLLSALQIGPVSINMFADFHMGHYQGGVLSYSNCSEGTNHGVLAVGYGTCSPGSTVDPCTNVTNTIDYWKVKNSWGASFGDEGYFYLARGVYAAGCGPASILLTNPSYPIMAQ